MADGFGLSLKMAKANFFDRDVVLKKAEAAERRILSKSGAFVRTRARTSIKRRKGISAPGNPPHAHVKGTDGIKKILFYYEANRSTVVVGPVKFGSDDTAVPGLLERGGRVSRTLVRKVRDSKGRIIKKGRRVNQRYLSRPFMAPALAAEAPKFPSLWKDAVR